MTTIHKSLVVVFLAILCSPFALADLQSTIANLGDRDWTVRQAAVRALGDSNSESKQVIAALSAALQDPDSRVRRAAADVLGQIGEKAYRSIPDLVEAYDDIDPGVVAAAARATGRMGRRAAKAVDDLTELLDHDDARVRAAALLALGELGSRSRASAGDLNAALRDHDANVRAAAAVSLGQLGPKADVSISDLVRALDDGDDAVSRAASAALVEIGKPAVPALVRALGNGDPIFLQAVVDTLGRVGSAAVGPLTDNLEDRGEADISRSYAAMALAQIADRDDRVVPALVNALADEKSSVRMSAAEALGHAGAAARAAVPQLIDTVTDPREELLVREFAIAALVKIDPGNADVEKALVYVVSDGNARIYEAAVEALKKIRAWRRGEPNIDAQVAALVRELDGGSVNAAESLGLIGDEAGAAVPSLVKALESDDPALRDAALIALERIGPQSQAVPALAQAMASGDLASRGAAAARLEAFARSRIEVWQPLLHQSDAPILRNWLARHEALYGFEPEDELFEPRGEERPQASYFDVMGGRAAIRESMQLELIEAPESGLAEDRDIDIDRLEPVQVASHPFDRMLEDSDRPLQRVALADVMPQDRFFAWFRNIDALRDVLDGGAGQFARFESTLAIKSLDYDLAGRYQRLLQITDDTLSQVQILGAVGEIAIVAPDLFFIDGTDLTIVARLRSASVTRAVLELLGLDAPGEGEVKARATADGGELFWTIRGDLLLLSSDDEEVRRMLDLNRKRDKGSLGNSSEFLYMQQQLSIGDDTQAYLYFSDPFIRRLVSPAVKVAQLRRMEARAEMEILAAGAMLYLLDGHRHVPSKQQLIDRGYAPRYLEKRDYRISEELIVSSEEFGTIAALDPLRPDAVTHVSQRESRAYAEFVRNYTSYWRQFFDPIAIRLDAVDENSFEMQSFILPLLDSRVYNEVRDALVTDKTGNNLSIPSVSPAPSMMLSLNVNDDLRVNLSQGLADMLVEYTSVDPEIFDSIGSGIHLAVQDSTPIVALGGGDVWGAVSKEMLNLEGFDSFLPFIASIATQPSTIMIELADPDKVREFLSEAVVRRAEVGGSGELHKVQGREAWIYTLDVMDIVQIHLRLEIQGEYFLISNLPWTTAVHVGPATTTRLNGAQLSLDLSRIDKQLPALHTKIFTDYRAAAVDGMGYIYPLIAAGVADGVGQALDRHREIFGFSPVHPSSGNWLWRDSYLESTEFGTAKQPVQPAFNAGNRNFGLFPDLSLIEVNMQLEDTGLRAIVTWRVAGD